MTFDPDIWYGGSSWFLTLSKVS